MEAILGTGNSLLNARYWTQGFPAITGVFLPLTLFGAFNSHFKLLFFASMWYIAVFSLLGHKEFRFIYPILPIALAYAGKGLSLFAKLFSYNGKLNNMFIVLVFSMAVLNSAVKNSIYTLGCIVSLCIPSTWCCGCHVLSKNPSRHGPC